MKSMNAWGWIFCILLLDSSIEMSRAVEFEAVASSFVQEHCIKCHGPDKEKGDMRLDRLGFDLDDVETALTWQDVVDIINLGEMPPEKEPRPDSEVLDTFLETVQSAINLAAERSNVGTGPQIRRLSHSAMDNSMRDLLGMGIDGSLSKDLPDDPEVDGFDNLAQTMELSLEALSQIQTNAQIISRQALMRSKDLRDERVYELKKLSTGRKVEQLGKFKAAFSNTFPHTFGIWPQNFVAPFPGIYRISVDAFALDNRKLLSPGEAPPKLTGKKNSRLVKPLKPDTLLEVALVAARPEDPEANLEGKNFRPDRTGRIVGRFYISRKLARYELPVELDEGEMVHVVYASVKRSVNPPKVMFKGNERFIGEALYVNRVGVAGPVQDVWPSKAHEALLGGQTKKIARKEAEERIRSFLAKAFRRPVSKETVAMYLKLYDETAKESGIEGAMGRVVEATLCSPRFLMNYEEGDGGDDWALANRLSYFLWNSMPDDELFELAASGEIRDRKVMNRQVARLLADPKSQRFVEDFVGQWLGVNKLGEMQPDRRLFPRYSKALEDSMRSETELFFRLIMDNNLPISNFIDSDFTVVNEVLAKHYGLEGVKGGNFRVVELDAKSPRGGVLSQGSILTLTSNGTRTSPIVRGIWVLERILGSPPNPPPPDVEPLEPDVRGSKTIKDMLAKHREVETCNECHRKIDPWGFAMENFDPVGVWRDHYGGYSIKDEDGKWVKVREVKVDASTRMVDGTKIKNFEKIKEYLVSNDKRLAIALAEKLMSYALGYQCGPRERLAIDKIVDRLEKRDYPLGDLVLGICLSDPFMNSADEKRETDFLSAVSD